MRAVIDRPADNLAALRASLREQLAALRGVAPDALPAALLDITVQRARVPGGDVFLVRPVDWEELRHEEGGDGRPVPYWATPWPSGAVLAGVLAEDPPAPGTRVLELGCGLALPSIVAARAGARVLATDGHSDAVAFAAHSMALNEVEGEVAVAEWASHGDALAARGPWDLVLAADVLYERRNVDALLALLPRLVGTRGEVLLADPGRPPAAAFLERAHREFELRTTRVDRIAVHRLRARAR